MKTRCWVLCVAIALACPTARAEEKNPAESVFHPPQTEAEKAVDEIVRASIANPDLFFIILQRPGFDLSKNQEFEPFFTDIFLNAWRRFEKELVNGSCGGKYQTGKNCGMDFNPIVCSDHLPAPYFYRTIMGDDGEALIALALETDKSDNNVYYMRREKSRWRMEGLSCELDEPYTTPAKHLLKKFRQPRFDSEKRLMEILQTARTSKDLFSFIFDLSWRDPSTSRQFSGLFTSALLLDWRTKAKTILQRNCRREYYEFGEGECDWLPDAVFCNTSEVDLYVERTTVEQSKSSIVTYSHPGGHPRVRYVYRLSKEVDGWKLDGVDCDDNKKFHMP